MSARRWWFSTLMLALGFFASQASARVLSIEVRTDRGHDAVYRVGDPIVIEARSSEDTYLTLYEIDAEGYVHLLYPEAHRDALIEADRTYRVPDAHSDFELVARGPVGQGYVVAIASYEPFRQMPWYLRPYDVRAEEMGYYEERDDEEGITAEGRIVGDPFVAMERIRRRVLADPEDARSYATAYTAYYVGHEVRYPRYLCNDCHRPNNWAWWSGFDPYGANCRAFDFRVNASWMWGPPYWNGFVPYYMFVYRNDCPPRYLQGTRRAFSSWDGWRHWRSLWGGPLRRYKSDPPPVSAHDPKYDPTRRWPKGELPPGYLSGVTRRVARNNWRDPFSGGTAGEPRNGEGRRKREGQGFRDPARPLRDPSAPHRDPDAGQPRPERERRWGQAPAQPRDPSAPHRDPDAGRPNSERERRWGKAPAQPRERDVQREEPRPRRIDSPEQPRAPRERRYEPIEPREPRYVPAEPRERRFGSPAGRPQQEPRFEPPPRTEPSAPREHRIGWQPPAFEPKREARHEPPPAVAPQQPAPAPAPAPRVEAVRRQPDPPRSFERKRRE